MSSEYSRAVGFLESFVDYERISGFTMASWKLDRVKSLFKALKISTDRLRVIHVAGTKGKGSTATFIAFILANCGFRVGLYTSPHFHDLRERIALVSREGKRVRRSLISKGELSHLVRETSPLIRQLDFSRRLYLSFFEVYTALAFKYFLDKEADFVVLECGMGGRLDATNISRSLVSVITHIGHDHTQYLGKSLEKIALEKAGVIKPRKPVVCADQRNLSYKVLRKKTRICKSPLYMYKKDFIPSDIRLTSDHTLFNLSTSKNHYPDLEIRLKGRHQVENASLAVVSCELLKKKYGIDTAGIYKGLKEASIAARFEILKHKECTFLFDIAHNPSSIAALDTAIKAYFKGRKVTLVFGASSDKDVKSMLSRIDYDTLLLTKSDSPRAQDPYRIKKRAKIRRCIIEQDLKRALDKARSIGSGDESIIVVTGSLFLVALARRLLRRS